MSNYKNSRISLILHKTLLITNFSLMIWISDFLVLQPDFLLRWFVILNYLFLLYSALFISKVISLSYNFNLLVNEIPSSDFILLFNNKINRKEFLSLIIYLYRMHFTCFDEILKLLKFLIFGMHVLINFYSIYKH